MFALTLVSKNLGFSNYRSFPMYTVLMQHAKVAEVRQSTVERVPNSKCQAHCLKGKFRSPLFEHHYTADQQVDFEALNLFERVLFTLMSDLIVSVGHYDLYFMVQ